MAELTKCPNGHIYDRSTYQACPYCHPARPRIPGALADGTILSGRFRLQHALGQGGFAITYLAEDLILQIPVVVKECFPAGAVSRASDGVSVSVSPDNQEIFEEYRKLLYRETLSILRLRQVNIPGYIDFFQENNTSCSVMEYIPGPTLKEYMDSHGGRLTVSTAKTLLLPVLDDLDLIHERGIIHCDIAPDNLIISDSRNAAVLIDFCASQAWPGEEKTSRTILKRGFAPPEQYMRRGELGPWTDVYAFAATFYYAITGKLPPEAAERIIEDTLAAPSELGVRLDSRAEAALLKMLSPTERQERCAAAEDFRRALSAIPEAAAASARYESYSAEDFASTCALPSLPATSIGFDDREDTPLSHTPEYESHRAEDFAFSCALSPRDLPQAFFDALEDASLPHTLEPDSRPESKPMPAESAAPRPRPAAQSEDMPAAPRPKPAPVPAAAPKAAAAPRKGLGGLFSGLFQKKGAAEQTELHNIPATEAIAPAADAGASPSPVPLKLSDVSFSALFPKRFIKGEYSVLEIYIYEEDQRRILDEAIAAAGGALGEKRGSMFQIGEKSVVSVRLECADSEVQIDGSDERQIWYGKYLIFSFSVFLRENYPKRQLMFTATVLINGVPATRLRFTADCNTLREQKMEVAREDILSAYVSYASQDRGRVTAIIQGMKKARPDMDVFFDIDNLRSGEDWSRTLRAEIERRDILFLCWSLSAMRSEWVEREWRYALSNKGLDSIEPIPIDPPAICPPPKELSSKSFNDRRLYYIDR